MRKRTFVLVMGFALAAVLATGGLLASNMGFKINYTLNGAGANGFVAGENHVAMPFNKQLGMTDAAGFLTDVQNAPCGAASVQRFDPTLGFRQTYTGGKIAGTNFALGTCESYFVQMNAGQTCGYIIVGSHDPNAQCTFNGTGVGGFVAGENNYALPYHTTANNAAELLGQLPNAASVQRFEGTLGFRQTYTGGKIAGTNFAVTPGEGYFVQMTAGQTATITPDHY